MRREDTMEPPPFEREVLQLCRCVALQYGVVLDRADAVMPLNIELAIKGDPYARGVLSMVAELARLLRQTSQGRQALPDFLLEPVLQDVERPGGSGRDD